MGPTHPDNIGGGRVARAFNLGSRRLLAGTVLSRDEILSMAYLNRNALIEKGLLVIWPPQSGQGSTAAGAALAAGTATSGERFVVPLGFGRYDVVQGRKLNDGPIGREDAYNLAGIEPPKKHKPPDEAAPN